MKVVNPRAIIAGRQEMIVYYYPEEAGSMGLYSLLFVLSGMAKNEKNPLFGGDILPLLQ